MPAKSQDQRAYLNAHFGHEWVKEHDFDTKGKLPKKVKRRKGSDEMDELVDLVNSLEPGFGGLIVKGTARAAELNLRVGGVTRHASGDLAYKMETRDGHYVGRTNPTKVRAKKGDILKVQASDFMQDVAGDAHWQNPNVVSHYDDSAHSWRELCAIAGGDIVKDGPATSGDVPAGDEGHFGEPSAETLGAVGPTIDSVHVNRPLKNISVSYAGRSRKLAVKKTDNANQLIYGVVLEPNSMDSQDDFMYPDQVEKAAHTYMRKVVRGTSSVSKLQHVSRGFHKGKPSVVPVESFIAPVDFSYDGKEMVKKGTWVMVLHAEDAAVWDDVTSGKYTGLSIGGTGVRQEIGQWMSTEPTWASST